MEDGREFEKEEWKLAEISTVFELAKWKMEESLRRKSGSWQIITVFEKAEWKMEESSRRKSGS